MRTALGLAPLAAALVAFEVYCIVELVRRPVKLLPRWLWLIICLVSVPLGGVLYLVLGRGEPAAPTDEPTDEPTDQPSDEPSDGPPVWSPSTTRRAAAVESVDVRKVYGDRAALDGVSLSVPTGSVFGLVGPNGAGKTTLLAILAGLRRPDAGSVALGDGVTVALLPDTPQFEPWLTAREVVDLARELALPDAPRSRTDEALQVTGLTDAADRRTGGFSRGMLQRLGLAATIVGEPEVLLLDEPCSALDPSGRREVLDFVGWLGGTHTVLFCSHILDDVQEVCDAVGVLRDGRLLFQGPLDQLLVGRAAPAYRLRLRAPLEPSLRALRAEPWVVEVTQAGAEEVHVIARSTEDAERQLLPVLAAADARVVSIVPSGADLEQVFLELMSSSSRAARAGET